MAKVSTQKQPVLSIKLNRDEASKLQALMQNIHPQYTDNEELSQFAADMFAMIADEFNDGNLDV